MTQPETRQCENKLTVEKREDGHAGVISGYAIVYNKDSEDLGFIESIKQGAARNALKKEGIPALIDHDPSKIVGRSGKNLTLKEDKTGVFIELKRPRMRSDRFEQLASDIENGFIDKQSFAFTVGPDGAKWDDDFSRREVVEIEELFDISLVTYPAYTDTSASIRSQDVTAALKERDEAKAAAEEKDKADAAAEDNEQRSKEGQTDPTVELDTEGATEKAEGGDAIPTVEPPTEAELDKRYFDALRRQEGF